jgi:hypothetical protein
MEKQHKETLLSSIEQEISHNVSATWLDDKVLLQFFVFLKLNDLFLQTKFVVFSFANEWICYPDRYFQIN